MSSSVVGSVRVLMSPAEFEALSRDPRLPEAVCVVFDVLRATSTVAAAFGAGVRSILPVEDIPTALEWHRQDPELLLAGERDGVRIRVPGPPAIEFDLGNSPREYTPDRVAGRRLVVTTTNGTRALRAASGAQRIWAGSLANLKATARALLPWMDRPVFLICSGTYEDFAYEDLYGAGGLLASLEGLGLDPDRLCRMDSARLARETYAVARVRPMEAIRRHSRNGRRLLAMPELADDVTWCLEEDRFGAAVEMGSDGWLRAVCTDPARA